jgi:hypothetical protein
MRAYASGCAQRDEAQLLSSGVVSFPRGSPPQRSASWPAAMILSVPLILASESATLMLTTSAWSARRWEPCGETGRHSVSAAAAVVDGRTDSATATWEHHEAYGGRGIRAAGAAQVLETLAS